MKLKINLLLIFIVSLLALFFTNYKIMAKPHYKTDVVMFGDSLTANGK